MKSPPADRVASPDLSRREALVFLGGLAALLPGAAAAQGTLDRTAFLRASSLVTGVPEADLTELADPLLAAFQAQSSIVLRIAALANTTTPEQFATAIAGTPLEAPCQQLAAAWYTGTIGAGRNAKLVSYDDALAWKAVGMDIVPGNCAGEFGFWSEPPATH